MAPIPPHLCARCHRPVVGRCPHCLARHEQSRGSAAERGYTSQWAAYSREWLRLFPWCGMRNDGTMHVEHSYCARAGLRVRATVTDHIVSMRRGGAQFDPLNHQSLCSSCNARKSVQVEGAGFWR